MHLNDKFSQPNGYTSSAFSPLGTAAAMYQAPARAQDTYRPAPVQAWAPTAAAAPAPGCTPPQPSPQAFAPQPHAYGQVPAMAPTGHDGLAGRALDIPYKSDSAGAFPAWLEQRMTPAEFRSVHRRLRSAYMKGRVKALKRTGLVSAVTCSLGTPIMVFATRNVVQKERVKEARELNADFANRGVRIDVGQSSPVSIRLVLS